MKDIITKHKGKIAMVAVVASAIGGYAASDLTLQEAINYVFNQWGLPLWGGE